MTATNALDQMLDDLDRRIGLVEQIASGSGDPNPVVDEVVIDDGTHPPVIINTVPPDDVANVTVTPGTFFEDIFADVEWDAPTTGIPPTTYDVDLGDPDNAYSLYNSVRVVANNYRFVGLEPGKDYAVRVTPASAIGRRGNPSPWVDFTTGYDATIPAAVQNLVVFRAPDALIATWTGNTEADVQWGHGVYEVEISTDNFATIAATLRTAATVCSFEGIVNQATYKVRIRAIDSSGNAGPDTTSADVVAGSIISNMIGAAQITATTIADDAITTPKIAANAVTAAEIAALTITAAQIAASTITGAKIAAATISATNIVAGTITAAQIAGNTITADKLTTSTLTAANITINGGSFKIGNPPTDGVLLNSQGLRCYDAGVVKMSLDSTGAAVFSDSIFSATIASTTMQTTSITSSFFYWPGGSLTSSYGLVFDISSIGYEINKAITWQKSTSPFTHYWAMYGSNASEMYIARQTIEAGQYSWLHCRSDRSYFESSSGSLMGYFFYNGSGSFDHGLTVIGYFTASTKSFVIDHPTDPKKLLAHGCIEGPELAVFYRGKEMLSEGIAIVALPDYFEALTRKENRTIQVTPISDGVPGDSSLIVSEIEAGYFFVEDATGLHDSQSFYWTVMAERADVDRLEIEFDKDEIAGADMALQLMSEDEVDEKRAAQVR